MATISQYTVCVFTDTQTHKSENSISLADIIIEVTVKGGVNVEVTNG